MSDISLQLDQASPQYKDFLVVNNDLILTSDSQTGGNNPVLQDILQALSMFLGEWFMDITQGTPWLQQILVKNPDQGSIDAIFRNIIMGRPGVMQLSAYKFTPNFSARNGALQFSALTTSGVVNYNGVLAPIYSGNQSSGVLTP